MVAGNARASEGLYRSAANLASRLPLRVRRVGFAMSAAMSAIAEFGNRPVAEAGRSVPFAQYSRRSG